MSQLAHKPSRRVARKLRVGIKGQDKSDRLREFSPDGDKRRVRCTTQQAVQFMELAAFALPSHPFVLLRIPFSCAVHEQKTIGPVAQIEARNPVQCRVEQCLVGRRGFRGAIGPVGQ